MERGKAYCRVRRTVDGRTIERKKRCKLDTKLQREVEGLAEQIDSDIAFGKSHTRETISKISQLDSDWLKLFISLELIPKTFDKSFNIDDFLEDQLSIDMARVEAGEIVLSTYNKLYWSSRHFTSWCHSQDIRDVRKITKENISGPKGYILFRKTKAADTTVQNEVKWLRSYFKRAVELEYIHRSPFENVVVKVNPKPVKAKRLIIYPEYLDQLQDYLKDNYPDTWYVYFMVCRYTGCRRNEALLLQWRHVDLEIKRLTMPSPKTAHKGQDMRRMPLWSELEELFLSMRSVSGAARYTQSKDYVVSGILGLTQSNRDNINWDNKNPTTTMNKLVKKAGLKPIKSFFQNLRRTRENTLLQFGTHRKEAIHAFLGHTEETFDTSYRVVNADDLRPEGFRVPNRVPKDSRLEPQIPARITDER